MSDELGIRIKLWISRSPRQPVCSDYTSPKGVHDRVHCSGLIQSTALVRFYCIQRTWKKLVRLSTTLDGELLYQHS